MTTATHRRPPPTGPEFLREVVAVAADIPRFAAAPFHRRQHQRWGASDTEVSAPMPGDDLVPKAQFQCTRAVTIHAPRVLVWPWLVQVGCLRAGFYADDLLDNLGHPSARSILPEFQTLKIGQWVPMAPAPTEITAFTVAGFEPNRWLLWTQPTSTWAWRLSQGPDSTTRLVTRLRIFYDWNRPAAALFSLLLTEFGDFPMMRRMLLGIKTRRDPAMTKATTKVRGAPTPDQRPDPTRDPIGPKRRLRRTEKALVVLEIFISICGLGGGAYMATHPLTTMPLRYLEGTWFHTWRWPGVALFFFVGICPAVVAAATLRRMPVATLGHLCVGAGLVTWILLEAAWIVVSPPLQITVGLIGLAPADRRRSIEGRFARYSAVVRDRRGG